MISRNIKRQVERREVQIERRNSVIEGVLVATASALTVIVGTYLLYMI
jgi:hypothetical protein